MTTEMNTTQALQIGELLKVEREKQGVSTKQIATALNLPERFILYLESGEFDKLPGNTFVRGYIRNYVKHLNLNNEQEIISLFEQQVEPEVKEGRTLDFKQIKRLKSISNSIYWLISFVVCLVLAGVLFLIWQHYISSKINEQSMEAVATSINTVAEADRNTIVNTNNTQTIIPLSNIDNSIEVTDPQETESLDSEAADTEIQTSDLSSEPDVAVNVKKGEGRVQATFSANCWVSIKDATGKEVIQGVYSPKKSIDITGKEPFDVMIGAPNTISLTYNGKPIKIEAKSSSSHRIKLGN